MYSFSAHVSLRVHPSRFANGCHSSAFTAACAISPPTALRLRRHHHTANTLRFASSFQKGGYPLIAIGVYVSVRSPSVTIRVPCTTYWEVLYERIVKLTKYSTSYTKFLKGIPIRFIQIRLDEDGLSLASAIESSDGLNR